MKTAKIISWFWAVVAIALVTVSISKAQYILLLPASFAYLMHRLIDGAVYNIEKSGE